GGLQLPAVPVLPLEEDNGTGESNQALVPHQTHAATGFATTQKKENSAGDAPGQTAFNISQANVIQLYGVTAEWLKGSLGYTTVRACRDGIGDEAFQLLLKKQTEDIPDELIQHFISANKPLQHVNVLVEQLGPLAKKPLEFKFMEEALRITNYVPDNVTAIKDYLLKYNAKGDKILGIARLKLTAKGNDPVEADKLMIAIEPYNYNEELKNKAEGLGVKKATDEYDKQVESNKSNRSSYISDYAEFDEDIDDTQSDEAIATALSDKKATDEHSEAVASVISDKETFIAKYEKDTGKKIDAVLTRHEVTKGGKVRTWFESAFVGEDFSTVVKATKLKND
ncbi:MAG TPA: hypothetical protein VKH37_00715, partial [Ferruginibacter sp.]|nr:hypothetical protein [Ferruginibacter sp.]